jgi:hypothetical protein
LETVKGEAERKDPVVELAEGDRKELGGGEEADV